MKVVQFRVFRLFEDIKPFFLKLHNLSLIHILPKRPPEPKSIRIRNFPKGSDDRDTKAAEPEDLVFGQAETTPVDAPQASIGLQKQQAGYTNFRTAIDNQFLPWAWNVLHDQEIQFLVAAIEAEVHKDGEHKIGAWLASLSLATGLPTRLLVDVMLNDASGDSHSIVRPDIWNRQVITPENAFIPCLLYTSRCV